MLIINEKKSIDIFLNKIQQFKLFARSKSLFCSKDTIVFTGNMDRTLYSEHRKPTQHSNGL